MKVMRRTAVYSLLGHRRNDDILEKFDTDPTGNKLARCKHNWLDHVTRMKNTDTQRTSCLQTHRKTNT